MKQNILPYRDGKWTVIYDARLAGQTYTTGIPGKGAFKKLKTTAALSLLALSLSGLLTLFLPILIAEIKYRTYKLAVKAETRQIHFGDLLWLNENGVTSPKNWQFSVIIPEAGINAKISSAVNANDKNLWQAVLKEGVAHAAGTSFPDESGTTYIFGHSTDYLWNVNKYNAYFYPLKYVKEKDKIILVFNGKPFTYRVAEKKIVEPDQLQYFESAEKRLVLQTCWPPGTTSKRLLIIAYPEENLTSEYPIL